VRGAAAAAGGISDVESIDDRAAPGARVESSSSAGRALIDRIPGMCILRVPLALPDCCRKPKRMQDGPRRPFCDGLPLMLMIRRLSRRRRAANGAGFLSESGRRAAE
jgi:hypothetical protein